MKIPPLGKDILAIYEKKAGTPGPPRTGPVKPEGGGRDQVTLSSGGKEILEAEKAQAPEDVRTELVERIRKQIRQGTYAPDSRAVAERWMAQVRADDERE